MRVFLTLCSLAAVALAKPQYNYGSGVSGSFGSSTGSSGGSVGGFGGFGGLGGGSSGSIGGGGNSGYSSGSLGGGSLFGSGGSSFGRGGSSSGSGLVGGGFQSSSSSNYNQFAQQQGAAGQQTGQFEAPFVHKQFITVSAPEDNENLERTKHLVIGRPQKNYRVVFIKAPSSSNANVKLSAEYAPQEEKTVIYVLSKKDSSLEVGDIATPAPSIPSKPEVFFIKYKTEEEAQHAQSQIQAEYDRIEGTSEHTDAGVAPQQSVVGILDNGAGAGAGAGAASAGHGHSSGSGVSGTFIGGASSSGSNVYGSTGSASINAAKSSAYLPPAGH